MIASTVGFGAPAAGNPHCWLVRIPRERGGAIIVLEDVGRNGWPCQIYDPIVRAIVPRKCWEAVASALQVHLNKRLKEVGIARSRFVIGDNPVERVLGMELCLLAWAIDDVTPEQAREAFDAMATYMPCEIRCLYQYAARDRDLSRPAYGWRKAIKFALIASRSAPGADQMEMFS